tara:strand:- start:765 stop:1061 length:297 start_codon:yes stop_codon:yes gene_type:complete
MKCAIPDNFYTVGNCDTGQGSVVAAKECVIPDTGEVNIIWKRDARHASAALKCATPDARDAIRNDDARQGGAAIECVIPDAGDAVWNGDARQASAGLK